MSSADASQALAMAVALFNTGHQQDALLACQRALAAAPDHPGLQQLHARLLLSMGDAAQALSSVQAVVARYPDHAPALRLQAEATLRYAAQLVDRGQASAAVPLLKAIATRHVTRSDIWYECGRALQACGRLREAIEAYERASAHDPGLTPVWFARALCCEDLGLLDEAADALATVLTLEPGHVEALFNLALVEQGRGRLEAALDGYARAWRLRANLLGRIAMALCSRPCGAVWLEPEGLASELSRRAGPTPA